MIKEETLLEDTKPSGWSLGEIISVGIFAGSMITIGFMIGRAWG